MVEVRTDLYDRIVYALMDGPAPISELAAECDVTVRAADNAVRRLLHREAVIAREHIRSHYGRTERLFDLPRTRKAA